MTLNEAPVLEQCMFTLGIAHGARATGGKDGSFLTLNETPVLDHQCMFTFGKAHGARATGGSAAGCVHCVLQYAMCTRDVRVDPRTCNKFIHTIISREEGHGKFESAASLSCLFLGSYGSVERAFNHRQ